MSLDAGEALASVGLSGVVALHDHLIDARVVHRHAAGPRGGRAAGTKGYGRSSAVDFAPARSSSYSIECVVVIN